MSDLTPHVEPTRSPSGSLTREYFDRLYARRIDPWEFETSAYEASKYKATLAALPRARYNNALELGCSIGVLTCLLAPRCARLLATDVSELALSQARTRGTDLPQITFEQRDIAGQFPEGRFDLMIVSEVGYYLSISDLENLRENIAAGLVPGGHLLLVHYIHPTNYPLTGDAVHDAFLAWEGAIWRSLKGDRTDSYRLDLLAKFQS